MTAREFLYGLVLLALAFLVSGTTGDPDLWGHVRFGQDMLAQHAIRLPDTYSFTSDRVWVNHEWLAEVLMAIAFNAFGAAGLNVLRIAVVGCALWLVWRASAALVDRQRVLLLAACAVGIYMRAHPIRPQLFSLLFFTLLLVVLRHADDRRSGLPLAWVPVLMAAWVNLHGGWIVGLGYFAMWGLIRCADRATAHPLAIATALSVTFASTLVNPHGWHMWGFLAETVRVERPMIADWQPLHRLPAMLWTSWLTAFLVVAVAAARARTRGDWTNVAMAGALGLAAIRVSRLDAFFALAATFAATRVLATYETSAVPSPERRRLPALSVAFAVCILIVATLVVPRIRTIRVPERLMPDADVAAYAREQKLTGQVLIWFDWGEYLIWHFGPDLKVSMDGRRETVYSAAVVDAHMRFYSGTPDQWRYPDVLQADYVWIPKQLPVSRELQRQGWHAVCEGRISILLSKRRDAAACPAQPAPSSRLFPEL